MSNRFSLRTICGLSIPVLVTGFLFVSTVVFGSNSESNSTCVADHPRSTKDRTLKGASRNLFLVGVGLGRSAVSNDAELQLLKRQFEYITPENCMKPEAIQSEKGLFDFRESDALMDLANQHKIKVVGHCLVWAKDDRTPAWFFKDGDQVASRELLLLRMKRHMETVIGRYGGSIEQWDVVNEALEESDEQVYRSSGWLSAFGGPQFIVEAFKIARAADPDALLVYNDYRSELPRKRQNLFKLIKFLKKQGAPIDAVGLQGHYELDDVPYEDLDFTINELRKLGVKVVISEVDIDAVKRGKWWAEDGKYREELKSFDPFKTGLPADIAKRQADQYAKLFALYAKHADVIERVTFWNLHDGQSWLNYFPWDRVNHPLLFDRETQPKPAFDSVYRVLEKANSKRLKQD